MPTHTCFDDALDMMASFLDHDPRSVERLLLVHAICLVPEGPDKDQPFAHAWLEDGEEAWQAGFLDGVKVQFACRVADMVTELRVQHATKYTARQARDENHRSGHYGPWVEKYRALCRNGGK